MGKAVCFRNTELYLKEQADKLRSQESRNLGLELIGVVIEISFLFVCGK